MAHHTKTPKKYLKMDQKAFTEHGYIVPSNKLYTNVFLNAYENIHMPLAIHKYCSDERKRNDILKRQKKYVIRICTN